MASAAKTTVARKGSGKRRKYRGKCVLPSGVPRSSMGTAKIPSKTVVGSSGLCKPSVGMWKQPKYEVDGGGLIPQEVGKTERNGSWMPAPTRRVHRKGFYRSAA